MDKLFVLLYLLAIIQLTVFSSICVPNEDFCSECDGSTGLCKSCIYNVLKPDRYGGCSGIIKCFQGGNNCNECEQEKDQGDGVKYSLCKKCSNENYFPDGNGGCSSTENCYVSYQDKCILCSVDYYLDKYDNYICKKEKEDFFYCKESEDGTTCSKCSNYYHLADNKQCVFTNYCSIGNKNGYYCEECQTGYYLAKDGRSCTISENCEIGAPDNGQCIRCNEGYYSNSISGDCISNQEDNEFKYCLKGASECELCIRLYYLGEDKKCSTSSNCKKSENGTCIECSNNYYLGSLDNKCTTIQNCIKSDYSRCLECNIGYVFNPTSSQCVSEGGNELLKNCKIIDYSGTKCSECRDDYYLNQKDSKCYSNKEENNLFKCSLTNENGDTCIECVEGYYFGSLDNKCSSIWGCAKSETVDKCLECESYLCKNLKKGTCVDSSKIEIGDEDGICFQCKETNDEGTACNICQEEYNLTSTGLCMDFLDCVEGEDEKCLKCKELDFGEIYPTYCLNEKYGCIEGYIENCFKCDDIFDFNKCTQCYDGYWLDKDFKCKYCKEGCSKCTNSQDCNSCSEGYYITKEISDTNVECGKCIDGCEICNNELNCDKCFPGYYLTNEKSETGLLECAECSEGCIECSEENVCLICDEGYELVSVDDKILCEYIE